MKQHSVKLSCCR